MGKGRPSLRLERARKELAEAGRTQPQSAERTAWSDGMEMGEEGQEAPPRAKQIHRAEGAA